MHVSGLHISVRPDRLAEARRLLEARPGVEVHFADPATGRLVVVLETESAGAQEEGFAAIRDLPPVLSAELVYYRPEAADDAARQGPSNGPGVEA